MIIQIRIVFAASTHFGLLGFGTYSTIKSEDRKSVV